MYVRSVRPGRNHEAAVRCEYPNHTHAMHNPIRSELHPEGAARGADRVLVTGYHPGDCAYKTDNLGVEHRVRFARRLIEQLGLDERRMKMVFVSAAEGDKFAEEVNTFAEEI